MRSKAHFLMRLWAAIAFLFGVGVVAPARTIYVDANGAGDYPTIQAAIDAATDCDIIILQPGTYSGSGNRDIDFLGKAITVRSTDPNNPNIVSGTIIDCNGTESEPHRGFKFHSVEGTDSVLAGLTITNGYGPCEEVSYGRSAGGGLFILSNPMIDRCVISHSYAKAYGGGIYIGPLNEVVVSHCTIVENSTDSYGGGIYCKPDPKATILNCIIARNLAAAYGGGICTGANDLSKAVTVEHCTITDNWGKWHGGGIGTSAAVVRNCIIWGNKSDEGIPDISGLPAVSYSDVNGGFPGGGNINANPCFVDSGAGDYHLLVMSPCINAGDPQYDLDSRRVDIDGDNRIIFGRTDIGSDEFKMEGSYLFVQASDFLFEADVGASNPEQQILGIRNTGSGILRWTITEDCSWLDVQGGSGESQGQTDEVRLGVDILGLDPGLYECEITISDPASLNGQEGIKIALHIEDGDNVRHVPTEYNRIQAAIDWARQGDIILVADGVYSGEGNRDIDFLGKAITVRGENSAASCIINCQGSASEHHRGFIFQNDEGSDSILSGLTIINGFAACGGAIFCTSQSSPTISGCVINGNRAYRGGGICTEEGGLCSPMIMNCVVVNNTAIRDEEHIWLLGGYGGGIFLSGDGLGWWSCGPPYRCYPLITNSSIANNVAEETGGGVWGMFSCDMVIENSIVWGNMAAKDAKNNDIGIGLVYDACNPKYKVSYNNIKGGLDGIKIYYYVDWGPGNIDADPCFADSNNGDYHLKSQAGRWNPETQSWVKDDVTSTCIDAGDPMSPIGREPFPNGGRINMGAYGGTIEAGKSYFGELVCETIVAGDINGDCKVDFADFLIMAFHWLEDKSL